MINLSFSDQEKKRAQFIVVEGPIGVGKTSLAKRIANTFNYEILLEEPEKNPFLNRFYQNPKQTALSTQLFFLLQRAQQFQDLKQKDLFRPVRVADFLMEKDKLFAQITLDKEEYKLYEKIYSHLTLDVPQPDLVIYLQAPVDILFERIQKRGVAFEQSIKRDYLEEISEAYARFFLYYEQTPLLIVNATEIDLVNNDQDYEQLLNYIENVGKGRHYFNPRSMNF